jgi:hypothetical protein
MVRSLADEVGSLSANLRFAMLRTFCGNMSAPYFYAMTTPSKPFVVTRNKCIAPKQRAIERLPSGYSVRESRDDSHGRYWYVVTVLEIVVMANKKR